MSKVETEKTLAYLGPPGTFTELAGKQVLEWPRYRASQLVECKSISLVCELVAQRGATYGVVPLENSTAGDVKDTLLALSRLDLQIIDELVVPISHSLYMQPGARVSRIFTKDQAYYQCEQNLRKLYPDHQFTPVDSTALAVRMAAEDPMIMAIGSRNAAESLGVADKLERIDGIEDNPFNVTTFVVIRKPGETTPITGKDKTTFILSLRDQPGSLYHYLDVLQAWGINLNKIRSLGKTNGDTSFLISIDGHSAEDHIRKAMQFNPSRESIRPRMLGSYRRTEYTRPKIDGIPSIDHVVEPIRAEMENGNSATPQETAVVFTLKDEVGALAKTLRPFTDRNINLTAIDSMPTRRRMGEYAFYLTYDRNAPDGESAIQELSRHCTQVVLLNHV